MRKLLLIIGVLFLASCSCKSYRLGSRNSDDTYKILGSNRPVYPCSRREESVISGIAREPEEYQVNADSRAFGYVAVICYADRESLLHIRVGAGSEFAVGKCRFRVLKVYPFSYEDPVTGSVSLSNKVALQVLSYPKRCRCKNKALKAYDEAGLIEGWEDRVFKR